MKTLEDKGLRISVLDNEPGILRDEQAVLDLIGELVYNLKIYHLVIPAKALGDAFFELSSGFAGNILQKFVNYQIRVAIVGDFSSYTSKPLQQFIMESNQGRHVYFVASVEDALEKFHA